MCWGTQILDNISMTVCECMFVKSSVIAEYDTKIISPYSDKNKKAIFMDLCLILDPVLILFKRFHRIAFSTAFCGSLPQINLLQRIPRFCGSYRHNPSVWGDVRISLNQGT